jgi:hypothetical protein
MRLAGLFVIFIVLAATAYGTAAAPVADGPTPALPSPGKFTFQDYVAPVPASWVALQPSSNMRAAQYRVPGIGAGAEAELIVFYFGPAQGGGVQANIDRWVTQFSSDDGQPVVPRTEHTEVGGLRVTFVELNGTYARGIGSGPQGIAKNNQTLLVAIVETPVGNLTFQLHGDQSTVNAHRKSFVAMVRGFGRTT